jgi:hypothetical protein
MMMSSSHSSPAQLSVTIDDSTSTVVALLDPSLPSSSSTASSFVPVSWKDPHSDQEHEDTERLYLLLQDQDKDNNTTTIVCEVQALPSEYASYFITDTQQPECESSSSSSSPSPSLLVGRSTDLWCVSPVDALFFLLATPACQPTNTTTTTPTTSTGNARPWQPLDQLFAAGSLDSSTYAPLHATWLAQLDTLYTSLEIDEDTLVYKFNEQKALEWLTQKQQRVQKVLETQAAQSSVAEEKNKESKKAFSSSFTVSDDLLPTSKSSGSSSEHNLQQETMVSPNNTTANSSQESSSSSSSPTVLTKPRMESIQIVCSYLSPAWRTAFLQHMKESEESCLSSSTGGSKKRRVTEEGANSCSNGGGLPSVQQETDWNRIMVTGTASSSSTAKKVEAPPKLTVQQKKLAKTNVKGMSKMTAFFKKK